MLVEVKAKSLKLDAVKLAALSGSAARVETLALLRVFAGSKLSSTVPSTRLEFVGAGFVGFAAGTWVQAINASIGANRNSILWLTIRPPILRASDSRQSKG